MPAASSPVPNTDTTYPEPMSRLHRRVVPKKRRGSSFRYRTQPVTFSEIKEVDEDNVTEEAVTSTTFATSASDLHLLNQKFEEFKRTSDVMFGKSEGDNTIVECNIPLGLTSSKSMGRIVPSRTSV